MAKSAKKTSIQRPGYKRVTVEVPEELYILWLKYLNKKYKKQSPRLLEHIISDVDSIDTQPVGHA